ncbi:MAG: hypothetical protein GXO73_05630 [Calditrichaeota bacterium]|nr:hypothetical protein [Calditrichota bacterium]
MQEQLKPLLLTHLEVILSRLARDPAYGFVDTKFSTLDGRDFPDTDPIRGRNAVYGWIQARALEALAEHGRWLRSTSSSVEAAQRENLLGQLQNLLPGLVEWLTSVHNRMGRRLPFVFRPDGTPLAIDHNGRFQPAPPPAASTYGDLFFAKGLLAAGGFLSQEQIRKDGFALLARVLDDIETNRFRSNQQPLNPPYRSDWTSSAQEEGPWMIALGALELAYRESGDVQWLNKALQFIERLVERHVNRGQFSELQPLDFVETLAPDGRPLVRSGRVVCIPGHALEFVGLSAKILLTVRRAPSLPYRSQETARQVAELLPELFVHIFELGYRSKPGGLVASVDLLTRQALEASLPWWAVPEALRAAALLLRLAPDSPKAPEIAEAQDRLLNDLLTRWVNPKAYSWLFQTRDAEGNPVDRIPATPDADPAYHTGLSLLDFLQTQDEER